jgi:hypothetical protein
MAHEQFAPLPARLGSAVRSIGHPYKPELSFDRSKYPRTTASHQPNARSCCRGSTTLGTQAGYQGMVPGPWKNSLASSPRPT